MKITTMRKVSVLVALAACWATAKRFLDMGIDTILTNDYQPIADATGLR